MEEKLVAKGQRQKVAAVVQDLHERQIDFFQVTRGGQLLCQLCNVELAYRDRDTVKRHLGSQRHQNNVNVADLKKQIQVGKANELHL